MSYEKLDFCDYDRDPDIEYLDEDEDPAAEAYYGIMSGSHYQEISWREVNSLDYDSFVRWFNSPSARVGGRCVNQSRDTSWIGGQWRDRQVAQYMAEFLRRPHLSYTPKPATGYICGSESVPTHSRGTQWEQNIMSPIDSRIVVSEPLHERITQSDNTSDSIGIKNILSNQSLLVQKDVDPSSMSVDPYCSGSLKEQVDVIRSDIKPTYTCCDATRDQVDYIASWNKGQMSARVLVVLDDLNTYHDARWGRNFPLFVDHPGWGRRCDRCIKYATDIFDGKCCYRTAREAELVQFDDYSRINALKSRVSQRCSLCPLLLGAHLGPTHSNSEATPSSRKRKRKDRYGNTSSTTAQNALVPHESVSGSSFVLARRELHMVVCVMYGDDVAYMILKHAAYCAQNNPVWTSKNEAHVTMSRPPPPTPGASYGWMEVGNSGPYTSHYGSFPGEAIITIGDINGDWICSHPVPRVTLITREHGVRVTQSWYPSYPHGAFVYRVRMECDRSCARAFYALRAVSCGRMYVRFVLQKNVSRFANKLAQDCGFVCSGSKDAHFKKALSWVNQAQRDEERTVGASTDRTGYGIPIKGGPDPWSTQF